VRRVGWVGRYSAHCISLPITITIRGRVERCHTLIHTPSKSLLLRLRTREQPTRTGTVNIMKFAAYCLTTKNLALYLLLLAGSNNMMIVVAADNADTVDDNSTTANATEKARRDLEASCASTAAYHPDYSLPWSQGKCDLTITCYSRSYATELACCKAEYAGQESGYCLSQLDNPPTSSPTNMGGPDTWYPDYSLQWSEGKCINAIPRPNNANPLFASQLACCNIRGCHMVHMGHT